MPIVYVNVDETAGSGYRISIEPFRVVVDDDGQAIIWESNCPIMIDLDRKEHFPHLVSHAFGTRQESGPIADRAVAPNGTYRYKIIILVGDTDAKRKAAGYQNVICIDPDYKVDR